MKSWTRVANLLLTLFPLVGNAQTPDRLYVLIGSYHALPLADTFDYKETNPGLFLVWEEKLASLDLTLGAYENSFSDTSVLIGLSKTWPLSSEADLHGLIALSNYKAEDPIFQPLGGGLVVIPALQVSWRHMFLQATPIPDPDNTGIVFSYGLSFDLSR